MDIDGCTSLKQLDCNGNNLKSLDADGLTSLKQMDCSRNMMNTLDIDDCAALTKLNCGFNNLKVLDVSDCKKMKTLHCEDNCLETLDVSALPSLIRLDCQNNRLTSLLIGEKTMMLSIGCSNNKLSSLDLSKVRFTDSSDKRVDSEDIYIAESYGLIYCSDNLLTSLKLPENEKISVLECAGNELTRLDISKIIFITKNGYYSQLYYDKDKVKKLLLPKYSIVKLADKEYKGNPVKYNISSMKVKMGGYALNRDEKEISGIAVKHKNNKSIGLATVTIKDWRLVGSPVNVF